MSGSERARLDFCVAVCCLVLFVWFVGSILNVLHTLLG